MIRCQNDLVSISEVTQCNFERPAQDSRIDARLGGKSPSVTDAFKFLVKLGLEMGKVVFIEVFEVLQFAAVLDTKIPNNIDACGFDVFKDGLIDDRS